MWPCKTVYSNFFRQLLAAAVICLPAYLTNAQSPAGESERLTCETDSASRLRDTALSLLNSGHEQEAVEWFQKAADKGDLSAIYYCGMLRMKGIGTNRDTIAGYNHMRQAADKGFPQAIYDLSRRLATGDGVRRDLPQADSLLKKAAIAGSARAQWDYACKFRDGKGSSRNFHLAATWMAQSMSAKDNYAFLRQYANPSRPDTTAFGLYLTSLAHIFRSDFERADSCAASLARKGFDEGIVLSALCAIEMSEKADDKQQSDSLLRQAIVQLQSVPDSDMGKLMLYTIAKKGVDISEADSLFQQAADNGYAPAQRLLGKTYYFGRDGFPKNDTLAVRYFRMADEQGLLDKETAYAYATCLRNGLGGLQADPKKADEAERRGRNLNALSKMLARIADIPRNRKNLKTR